MSVGVELNIPLTELEDTEDIRAKLERAIERAGERTTAHVAHFRARLGEAERRDAQVLERRRLLADPAYDDCWCLGEGGRRRSAYGVVVGAGQISARVRLSDGSLMGPVYGYAEYCPCPDGDRVRAEHEAAHAALQAAYDAYTERSRAELARIPSIYDGLTLKTWVEAVRERATDDAGRELALTMARRVSAWVTGVLKPAATPYGSPKLPPTLLLVGGYGTGKSGLAAVIAREFLKQGQEVIYRKSAEILAELRAAPWRAEQQGQEAAPPTELAIIQRASEAGLLVLDDLGAEALVGPAADRCVEALMLMLDGRLNAGLPTVITTNLSNAELVKRVGGRLVDRIAPDSVGVVVALETPSLRRSTW